MNYQTEIKKEMEQKGYLVLNLIKLSVAGFPDLLCLKGGEAIFIECKEKTDTLKPLQKYKIDKLISIGFKAHCTQKGKGIIYPIK
jgi:Holliday junction resolvase